MGGLVCRYTAGKLYDPGTGLVLGLKPVHFITLATPHLGCDGGGVSQVPLLGWAGELPLIGGNLQKAMVNAAAPVTASIFGRSGEQLFLQDSDGPRPIVEQLTHDDEGCGHFLSALRAFSTRTAYANVMGDHVVGWANSSVRFKHQLPPLDLFKGSCVRECDYIPSSPRTPVSAPARFASHTYSEGFDAAQTEPRSPFAARSEFDCITRPSKQPEGCGLIRSASDALRPQQVDTYVNDKVTEMLEKLQGMPWRRVDVSYKNNISAFMAHNNIQVTRKWLNKAGLPTVHHLLNLLAKLENERVSEEALCPVSKPFELPDRQDMVLPKQQVCSHPVVLD